MSKWEGLTIKQWERELKSLLLVSDKALSRAIVVIWQQMTPTEQTNQVAVLKDGVGFNNFDAPLLSGYAKQLNQGIALTENQKLTARAKMPKYWRQLMQISKRKLRIK